MPSVPKSIRFASQLIEPSPKRQRISSDPSTSTLSGETASTATITQSSCWVTSEDLSSMVSHTADLQRVTNSWAKHHPLTGAEFEMRKSFQACEKTANSLRSALESLEVRAIEDSSACTCGDKPGEPHNTSGADASKDNESEKGTMPIVKLLKINKTREFLVKSGIERIIDDEFSKLSRFEGTLRDSTYQRWISHKGTFRDKIKRIIKEDTDSLVNFESKVKGYFQSDMIERATNEFKQKLEDQWKKHEKLTLRVISKVNKPSSTFHPRTTSNEPPRKRTKRGHEDRDYTTSDTPPEHILPLTIMAQPTTALTNTYIPHASLETISNKIKKLQSDISSAASGECCGPGKQKVLDCKHDLDVLASMVKGLDVQGAARKKCLDVLVGASIDKLFDEHINKAIEVVDENTGNMIEDILLGASTETTMKAVIKESLKNEPDVLLDFEAKFMRHFKEALAEAVARLAAAREKSNIFNQLRNI
ncbi:hypothetical protein QM012_001439 [Aureobasidium pullulans]|uniref:Uncharacterized protein n=1 Tax=Aureobasidium pullulans TaxID=5580 RepID=A0ABR0TE28_AURPU